MATLNLGAPTLKQNDVFQYTPSKPTLTSGANLAQQFGIDFDENAIFNKLRNATLSEYATKNQEFGNTENAFYQGMYQLGNTAADAIRRANASSIASGASKGVTQANILTSMLGMQGEGAKGATDLAKQRNLLKQQQAEAESKNVVDAMNASNLLKQDLMQNSLTKYGFDVQGNAAELQFYAALDAAAKEQWAAKYQADLARGAHWI